VIYSIPCECQSEYICETGRTLEVRVLEHKNLITKGHAENSKLAEHAMNNDHKILWDQARIIGRESFWKKKKNSRRRRNCAPLQ
jgi:hypothetical protein